MNPYAYIALVATAACLSCTKVPAPDEREMVVIDSTYVLDLPATLDPGYDMHDYASLQYYDTKSDFYIIGIEDAKENLGNIKRKRLRLKGYFNFVENTVFEKADSTFLISDQLVDLQGGIKLKSGDYFVVSRYGDIWQELFYRVSVYETQDYFFQVVIWTPYEEYCTRFDWIEDITHSFALYEGQAENGDRVGAR